MDIEVFSTNVGGDDTRDDDGDEGETVGNDSEGSGKHGESG